MPRADVVVVGAGLSGLVCALRLAESGASVQVVAAGHATSHWAAGPLDLAAPPGVPTTRAGLGMLAAMTEHPYSSLAEDVEPALRWLQGRLAGEGLPYGGDLDTPLRPLPTAVGLTRPGAIAPAAMTAALAPWGQGERLIIVGFGGFKDLWPAAVAASLRRPAVWGGAAGPATVSAVIVEVPELAGRRNLNALHLARLMDDPARRGPVLDAIAAAVGRLPGPPARIGLPAVLGLRDHAAALDEATSRLPGPVFELPLVPPSLPGLRLVAALRDALRGQGGRLQVGEAVARVDLVDTASPGVRGGTWVRVAVPAAAREFIVQAGAIVLATGGIAGGGLVATADGTLHESILGLPVEAPPETDWLAADPFAEAGHPLEAAGVRTDPRMRPLDASGRPTPGNVRVVGSLLAGQRYLRQRCGDGVAIASAWRAAASILGADVADAAPPLPVGAVA